MARSVLVVDDNASFRALAARVLTEWGHLVVGEAATAAQGLRRAAELEPDVALVDIGLPDGDGFTLTRQLQALPRPPRVVMISADADRANVAAAQRAGATGFAPKDDLPGAQFRRLVEGGP